MILTVYQIIFLTLVCQTFSYDLYDLSTLGQRISDDVNRQLAPLRDLGPRISKSVEEQMRPFHSGNFPFHNRFAYTGGNQYTPNLGLDNLGAQIEQNVYQGLEPVRAMEITMKLKGGVGGVTIVTFLPEGKKFLIRNYKTFSCSGSLSDTTGECSGSLTPFQIKEKADYCYTTNGYSIVNNQICIGGSSISIINNVVECRTSEGTPIALMPIEEYNKLCDGVSKTVEYKYIANTSDPFRVEIPSKNKYVKCNNNELGVCIFSESHVIQQGSNIFTSSNSGNFQSVITSYNA